MRVGQGRECLASCYLTMVARIEEHGQVRSLPIKPLEYVDEIEKRRYQSAIDRREKYRKQLDALQRPPSEEEYQLLMELHRAQDQPECDGILVEDLARGSWVRMFPEQENVPEKIFGRYVIAKAFERGIMQA